MSLADQLHLLSERDLQGPLLTPLWVWDQTTYTSPSFAYLDLYVVPSDKVLLLQGAHGINYRAASPTERAVALQLRAFTTSGGAVQEAVGWLSNEWDPHSGTLTSMAFFEQYSDTFVPPGMALRVYAQKSGVAETWTITGSIHGLLIPRGMITGLVG